MKKLTVFQRFLKGNCFGNILDAKGALRGKSKGKINFHQLREQTKEHVVKRLEKIK